MQDSIFDIFGTQDSSRQSTVKAVSKTYVQPLKGLENVRLKSSSVSDLPSKKAVGNVGNKLKTFSDAQESRKLSVAGCDQENSFIKPPAKTPLHKSSTVVQKSQTPNLKSAVRTPLSDIKAASSIKKQPLQNPPKSVTLKSRGKNTLLSEMNAVENIIKDDFEDLSGKKAVDVDAYEPIDDYEDIIPNSLRPSDEDIYRMVHFWEMHTRPLECEFEPVHPLVEELDNEFVPTFIPDMDLDEDLNPVPVPPMNLFA
jgi:hypothetical protein